MITAKTTATLLNSRVQQCEQLLQLMITLLLLIFFLSYFNVQQHVCTIRASIYEVKQYVQQ